MLDKGIYKMITKSTSKALKLEEPAYIAIFSKC